MKIKHVELTEKEKEIRQTILKYIYEYNRNTVIMPYIIFPVTHCVYENAQEAMDNLGNHLEIIISTLHTDGKNGSVQYAIESYEEILGGTKRQLLFRVNKEAVEDIYETENELIPRN